MPLAFAGFFTPSLEGDIIISSYDGFSVNVLFNGESFYNDSNNIRNITYGENINISVITDFDYFIYLNGSDFSSSIDSNVILASSFYVINITDSNNESDITEYNFTVLQKAVQPNLFIDGVESGKEINVGTNITINGSVNSTQSLELYINGVERTTELNSTIALTSGLKNVTLVALNNQNYSRTQTTYNVVVNTQSGISSNSPVQPVIPEYELSVTPINRTIYVTPGSNQFYDVVVLNEDEYYQTMTFETQDDSFVYLADNVKTYDQGIVGNKTVTYRIIVPSEVSLGEYNQSIIISRGDGEEVVHNIIIVVDTKFNTLLKKVFLTDFYEYKGFTFYTWMIFAILLLLLLLFIIYRVFEPK